MKGALIVGIDNYPGSAKLRGCVNDANDVADVLRENQDGSLNFSIHLATSVQTKAEFRKLLIKLFQADLHAALFYFSGHGYMSSVGGVLVTPDFKQYDEGISMDEILFLANQSKIKDKIIIVDCCHAGGVGVPTITGGNSIYLSEGTTIITAARHNESAVEVNGRGVFTSLLVDALKGGAADLSGKITPGSVYRYIDNVLSFWDQRPQFRTNVNYFMSLRNVKPVVQMEILRKIIEYFPDPNFSYPLSPAFEFTSKKPDEEKVAILKNLQKLVTAGLVIPVDEDHMYFAAMNSKSCALTLLGKHYWRLAKTKKI